MIKKFGILILFLVFLFSFSFSDDNTEIISADFEKAWNRFMNSNVFVMKYNSYLNMVSLIFPVGLSDEKPNKVGIRYAFFYSLSKKIDKELENNKIFGNVSFVVEDDYVNVKILFPSMYKVVDVLKVIGYVLNDTDGVISDIDKDMLFYCYQDVQNFYSNSFNSILFYFRQNIFASHPYSFLAYGNQKNVLYLTKSDFYEFFKQDKMKPYFFILINDGNVEYIYDYILNHYSLPKTEDQKKILSLDYWDFDQYYYRKVDIQKNRTFSFNISSDSSYFLYLFTAPEFNKNFDEYISMLIIDNLLSNPLDGVLWRELREKKGLVYSIYSEYPLLKYTSFYVIFTSCYYKNQGEVRKIMSRIIDNPDLSDDSIIYAKQRLISKIKFSFMSIDSFSSSMIYPLIYKDKRISPFYLQYYIMRAELDSVRKVYKKYFGNYYLFIFEGG